MPVIKQVLGWSDAADDFMYYISTNPTRDEFGVYKVILEADDNDDSSLTILNTLKDFGVITCIDYSISNDFQCGIGEKEGLVKVFNCMEKRQNDLSQMDVDDLDNFYDSKKTAGNVDRLVVKSKHPRPVNTLSFGQGNYSNLVAMGLDSHKTSPSLQIWDINYQRNTNNNNNSVIKNDFYVNNSFEYFVNESILSTEFIENNNMLISSNKWLREIDLRSAKPIFQVPITVGNDIKVNPFNSNIFATYSEAGTSFIWDRRKMTYNTTFSKNSASNLISPLKKDSLATSTSSASVKKFNHLSFRWSTLKQEEFSTLNNSETIKRWKMGYMPSKDLNYSSYDSLFVASVNTFDLPFDKVVTFDYIPRINNRTTFLCMRTSGTLYRASVGASVDKVRFSSGNDLISCDYDKVETDILQLEKNKNLSFANLKVSDFDNDIDENNFDDEFYADDLEKDDDDEEGEEEDDESSDIDSRHMIAAEAVLENDISLIMRERAALEYGIDPIRTVKLMDNKKIGNKTLYNQISQQKLAEIRNTWRWLVIAKQQALNKITATNSLDIGFGGCYGVWNFLEDETLREKRNVYSFSNDEILKEMELIIKKQQQIAGSGYPLQSRLLTSTDSNNNSSSNANNNNKKNYQKMVQRKVCMIVSGWDLSDEDVEVKYKSIMNLGQFERAAAWAVFFGDIPKCVEILSSSRKERLQLIATAVSGYSANWNSSSSSWKEQCRKMGMSLEDPYLRAIFTYISENDWFEIIYDSSISIRERLGIALRFLNDKDLTIFLSKMTETVVSQGQLEGLIFTGITPLGLDLLEVYVNKTSDVQTAASISIYGSPRYFKDERVTQWADTYKELLKSWSLFATKCKFDILRVRLSKDSHGVITAEQPERQVIIQCMTCKKNTHLDSEKIKMKKTSQKSNIVLNSHQNKMYKHSNRIYDEGNSADESEDPASKKFACQSCGALYPRCAICLLPLGISNLPIVIYGNKKEELMQNNSEYLRKKVLKYNEWFQFCLSCNHCMHVGHAEEWFERHDICPVPGCVCTCKY
ncbi:hypothetical protein HANVADRAFT_20428 [Hanseniaspora valbyensis NRRL Y-1626]|uniref:Uncharacterized protein n=1 Tax=Hanseniaspora valbyensis NRRL Y-1626 TaxID=766949 RepID=A0A1B7TJT9_9ASCO|nr:hypothetical protein HANVADRAFT_20428 [Hanseniaspora valbyensis NRRL Y-1626]